jgi:RNA polymerase sigma-70 factor (ECF subfamily)
MGTRTTVVGRQVRESSPEQERVTAFQELADRSLLASYRLASVILGDPAESQDAVHDAVVTAWQRWDSVRDRSKFEAWFGRIVVNTCRNRLQRSARRKTTDIAAESSLATPDASKEVHDRIVVEQALQRLDPDDRIVLALRHYRDLKIEDIAQLLDVPTTTANSRLRTARARLCEALERSAPSGVNR